MGLHVGMWLLLVVGLTQSARAQDDAYESARRKFYQLKQSDKKKSQRRFWVDTIEAFQSAGKQTDPAVASKAAFMVGELYSDLYRISRRASDQSQALKAYEKLVRSFPKSSLADDALWESSRIRRERGDYSGARNDLERILSGYPRGDMLARAQQAIGAQKRALSAPLVVIDPGHGGSDNGCEGGPGVLEKDVVLRLAGKLGRALRTKGIRVSMSRSSDEKLPLEERLEKLRAMSPDLVVSLHVNADPKKKASGVETFYSLPKSRAYRRRAASLEKRGYDVACFPKRGATVCDERVRRRFATRIHQAALGAARSVRSETSDRGLKPSRFRLLIGLEAPTALVELGFLSHRQERGVLTSSAYEKRLVTRLADAITKELSDASAPLRVASR